MTEETADGLERYATRARGLEGWVLEFEPEPLADGPSWDYEALARDAVSGAQRVLDIGTGGGEVFSRVLEGAGPRAVATEWWDRNAPVAATALRGRAPVVRCSSLQLPFADDAFDLVLSRHEEFDPHEIARVVGRGGRFLTQQVIPDHWCEIGEIFSDWVEFPDHFNGYREGLRESGFEIEAAEEFRYGVRFRELGPLVYHLAAMPWTLPGFDVGTHAAELAVLADRLDRDGEIVLTDGRYWIAAVAKAR